MIEHSIINPCIIYLVVINIFTFIIYGIDKNKAKNQQWRISEFILLLLASIGGVFGAWIGMNVFRHKTKRKKFQIAIPFIMIIWIIGSILLIFSSCSTTQNNSKITDSMYIQIGGGMSKPVR